MPMLRLRYNSDFGILAQDLATSWDFSALFCFVFFYFAMEQPGCLLRVLQTSHCCACLTYLTRSVKDLAITFAQYAHLKSKSQF